MAWICIPINESHPKISLLEVVVIQAWSSKSSLKKTSDAGDGSSQLDCQDDRRDAVTEDCHRTDNKCGREAYSKMVDSDEERSWSSSEEEQCTSGYERHFMPTASEILEVS